MYQYLLTAVIFVICSATDIKSRRVYNSVTAGYLLLALAGHLTEGTAFPALWAAGLLPGAFCFLLSWVSRQGFGYGDSMLVAICGVSLGVWTCLWILFYAFFWAGIWALVLFQLPGTNRKKEFPFVPFLLLGLMIQVMGGIQ